VGEKIVPGETTFFIENNEKEAIELLEQLKTKYIITDYGKAIGPGAFYGTQLWATEGESGYYLKEEADAIISTTRKYDKSMIVRLQLFDGREWFLEGKEEESKVESLSRFRLVYESKTPVSDGFFENSKEDNIKLVKIFEYVKGAKIMGNAPVGSEVEISTKIITNQERKFIYKKKIIAENGKFGFVVPYSTFGQKGWVENGTKFEVFAESYMIKINGIEKRINISEKDILEGNTITVK